MGLYSINRLLETFGFSSIPYLTKREKIAYVLKKLQANPIAFSGFLTALFSIHHLSADDIKMLNQNLLSMVMSIGEDM